jgi:peptide/nickel transport system ATP-binding protein
MNNNALLRVDQLSLAVLTDGILQPILDKVSFNVFPNQVTGLVGESGSGKTMTSLAIMRLLPHAVVVTGGKILYQGANLFQHSESRFRKIRGSEIAMVFQNPRASLNPLLRVVDQIARPLHIHRNLSHGDAYEAAIDLMKQVGIADASNRAKAYPHQLSGGMAQRVLIAMMLACRPKLLIADEPTTGLDVTIQAQIFELIKDIQIETEASVLLITHDLGVVSEVCDRVVVMYAGQVMEIAPVKEIFSSPCHPYTQRLLNSVMRVDKLSDLDNIPPLPPSIGASPNVGCQFASQCPKVGERCELGRQEVDDKIDEHVVYCCQVETVV